jgi:hypothetical protein
MRRRFRALACWLAVGPGSASIAGPADDSSPGKPPTVDSPSAAGGIACPPVLGPVLPCPPTVIHYAPSVSFLPTPFGFFPYAPPIIVASSPAGPWVITPPVLPPSGLLPGPFVPPASMPMPMPVAFSEPVPPPPPDVLEAARRRQPVGPAAGQGVARVRPVRRSAELSDRAVELMTFGDRNFRAGDLRRAEGRYREAMARAPLAATPRVRMAQVAFARGDFREAADWFREATAAEPSWVVEAEDVQALYAEPSEFHDLLASAEAHLQADPADRDAWLVLGAQLLLSDRADRAADIFLRLADRPPDATLSAFLRACGLVR